MSLEEGEVGVLWRLEKKETAPSNKEQRIEVNYPGQQKYQYNVKVYYNDRTSAVSPAGTTFSLIPGDEASTTGSTAL